jgi:hypothetical protein
VVRDQGLHLGCSLAKVAVGGVFAATPRGEALGGGNGHGACRVRVLEVEPRAAPRWRR